MEYPLLSFVFCMNLVPLDISCVNNFIFSWPNGISIVINHDLHEPGSCRYFMDLFLGADTGMCSFKLCLQAGRCIPVSGSI